MACLYAWETIGKLRLPLPPDIRVLLRKMLVGCHVHACVDMLGLIVRHAYASAGMAPGVARASCPWSYGRLAHEERTTCRAKMALRLMGKMPMLR